MRRPNQAADPLGEREAASSRVPLVRWSIWPPIRALRSLLLHGIMLPIYSFFGRQRTEGLEHLESLREGVIFTPNQTSNLDAFAVLKALPPGFRSRLAIVYFAEFFVPGRGRMFQRAFKWSVFNLFSLGINIVPLPQRGSPRESLEHLGGLLRRGHNVLMFPEGWVTYTGEMGRFKPGIGLLASMTHAPAVPVYIDGLFQVLPSPRRIPRRGAATVRFGAPLRFGQETREQFAERLENEVRRLGGLPLRQTERAA